MRHILLIAALWAHLSVSAQQDLLLTQYQFNAPVYNPAAVGGEDRAVIGLSSRRQWLGIADAPRAGLLYAHTPLRDRRAGVGLLAGEDRAGALRVAHIQAAYAYRIRLAQGWRLSGGLQAVWSNWRGVWTDLQLYDQEDPVFQANLSRQAPNFGAGIHLQNEHFYVGFSCPRIIAYNLGETSGSADLSARSLRHYYAVAGATIPLRTPDLLFQPFALLRTTGRRSGDHTYGSPAQMDINLSLLFARQFYVGTAYRTALRPSRSSNESVALWCAVRLRDRLRIGLSYDLAINKIQKVSSGSAELTLGYEFDLAGRKSPPLIPPQESFPSLPPAPQTPAPTAPAAPAEAAQTRTLQGIVFDMRVGLPAEGARVILTNDCGQAAETPLITTADGRYQFSLRADCCYTVTAQKDGLKDAVSQKICVQKSNDAGILRVHLDLRKQ